MNKPAIHRVVAGTKAARQHVAKSATIISPRPYDVDPEIRAHNAKVDAVKAAKKARKHPLPSAYQQFLATRAEIEGRD